MRGGHGGRRRSERLDTRRLLSLFACYFANNPPPPIFGGPVPLQQQQQLCLLPFKQIELKIIAEPTRNRFHPRHVVTLILISLLFVGESMLLPLLVSPTCVVVIVNLLLGRGKLRQPTTTAATTNPLGAHATHWFRNG